MDPRVPTQVLELGADLLDAPADLTSARADHLEFCVTSKGAVNAHREFIAFKVLGCAKQFTATHSRGNDDVSANLHCDDCFWHGVRSGSVQRLSKSLLVEL